MRTSEDYNGKASDVRKDRLARAEVAARLVQAMGMSTPSSGRERVKELFDDFLRHVDKFIDGEVDE